MTFIGELKRRNVFRVGAAYVLAAWVLLQIVDFVLEVITAPDWILQVFFLAAAVGLPIVLIFSWVFEMTPEGMKRESEIDRSQSITPNTGRKLDRVIIVFLAVAVVLLLADRFMGSGPLSQEMPQESVGGRHAGDGITNKTEKGAPTSIPAGEEIAISEKSIAVLPFLSLSSGTDDEYFADGLTEEILNSLAQLPELLVTARTSAFHFKGQDLPVQEIAAKLGVGTVVEGSVRRSGERLRVTAQLIRAADGFHLWSENYDSTSEDTIAVQEDIAEKIAKAMNIVLDEDKREAMRRAGLRDVEAFIAMQKGLEIFESAHGDLDQANLLLRANEYFELVNQRVPSYPYSYALHSDAFVHSLMDGASAVKGGAVDPAAVEQAMAQARKDYESAMRYAQTPGERYGYELDLAFFTGDWRGMPARIEKFYAEGGCIKSNWEIQLSLPFGYAQKNLPQARESRICDPLSSSTWRSEVRAHLWAGDPETALQTALKGVERAPGEWLSLQLIAARVALGQYEQAEAEIVSRLQIDVDAMVARILILGASGDQDEVNRLAAQYRQREDADDYFGAVVAAWAGDRELANQIAARVDAHAAGSPALSTTILWCMCGAPWDLSATPNFAADIKESGLTWPPLSPINFPLKDW